MIFCFAIFFQRMHAQNCFREYFKYWQKTYRKHISTLNVAHHFRLNTLMQVYWNQWRERLEDFKL